MLEAKASLVIRPPHLSVSLNQSTSADVWASASVVSGIFAQTDATEKLQQIQTRYAWQRETSVAGIKLKLQQTTSVVGSEVRHENSPPRSAIRKAVVVESTASNI